MVPVNQAALDTKIVPEPFRDRHKRKGIINAQESEHSVDKNAVEFIQQEVPKPEYASTSTSTTTSVGEKFFKGWGSLFDVADARSTCYCGHRTNITSTSNSTSTSTCRKCRS